MGSGVENLMLGSWLCLMDNIQNHTTIFHERPVSKLSSIFIFKENKELSSNVALLLYLFINKDRQLASK
jgi:hypothetical protein